MDISIIVCTHNRYQVLGDALKSIDSQDLDHSAFELVVVDNSGDEAVQRTYYSRIDLLCNTRVIFEPIAGLSRARNIGVRAAKAPVVAFIDDDAIAERSWASQLIASFARNPKAGVVGGPVRPIWPVSRPKWLHPWLEGFLTIVDRGTEERELEASEWLAGTNIAFLRDPLVACGLFDEQLGRIGRLLLSNEELSVTRKMWELGYTSVYNPKAEVQHNVHRDRIDQSWFRRRVFWQTISDIFDHDDQTQFAQRLEALMGFLGKMDPRDRGLIGLFKNLDDPEAFQAQTAAIAALVGLLATDARDWREYLSTKNG